MILVQYTYKCYPAAPFHTFLSRTYRKPGRWIWHFSWAIVGWLLVFDTYLFFDFVPQYMGIIVGLIIGLFSTADFVLLFFPRKVEMWLDNGAYKEAARRAKRNTTIK